MSDLQAAKAHLAQKAVYDSQYAAAQLILTAPLLEANPNVWRHVAANGIFFKDMLAERGWSDAERLMVTAAYSLFDGRPAVSLARLMDTLSPDNRAAVFQAMRAYAGTR